MKRFIHIEENDETSLTPLDKDHLFEEKSNSLIEGLEDGAKWVIKVIPWFLIAVLILLLVC